MTQTGQELTGCEFSFLRADQIVCTLESVERMSQSTMPEQIHPQVILFPESADEVQKIIQVANRIGERVWYVSTGKNWGYGCMSAPYSGGITIVLERMKRIYEVNTELGYAVIEPGVTYHDLSEHLRVNNIPLWTDSAGTTKSASVIGNALDKGRGLTPYADHFASLCGLEVILPDGTRLDTAPVGNYRCRHLYKWGVGPYIDGIFAQSNFGVVVKAGVWLMPEPEHFAFFAFEYKAQPEQFANFVNELRKLFFAQGILSRPHIANDFAMLCIVDQYPRLRLGANERRLSALALSDWKRKHGIQEWTFGGGLYGTKMQIRSQKELVRKHLKPFGTLRFIGHFKSKSLWHKIYRSVVLAGARLEGKSKEFLRQIYPAMDLFRGIPTDDFAKQVYFQSDVPRPSGNFHPAQDGRGFIWIGPLVPFVGDDIQKVVHLGRLMSERFDFDFFCEVIVEGPRAVLVLLGVFFEKSDLDAGRRAAEWYEQVGIELNASGYPPYRASSASSVASLDGNPTLRRFLGRQKMAIDPNQVLAPGKYGIPDSPRGN